MELYTRADVVGKQVSVATSSPRHFNGDGVIGERAADPADSFGKVLAKAVDQVNGLQQNADMLEEQMILYPDSVNVDEVMIASEKAVREYQAAGFDVLFAGFDQFSAE